MFGQDGVDVVTSELQQLHTMKTCVLLVPEEMTSAQKYKALVYLVFRRKKDVDASRVVDMLTIGNLIRTQEKKIQAPQLYPLKYYSCPAP